MSDTQASARFLSSYEWSKDRKEFGGYSGLVMSPDGADFTILSDRAHLIEGTVFRRGDRILGVRSKAIAQLDLPDALFSDDGVHDTEGLAQDAAGRMYVCMESTNRVVMRDLDGTWTALPDYLAISELELNRGLEGIAIDPGGNLLAIAEASGGLTVPFPVFQYSDDSGWSVPFHITRAPGFLPVGADFDPMGRLYVLERGFAGFGFFSQVRRFVPQENRVLEGEILLRTRSRRHDNLEGLSVWTAPTGELRVTMVSDDNFNRFQKTEFVEYAISM